MASVESLWTAPAGSEPMVPQERLQCVATRGIRGDRYMRGTGHYSPIDECQVTLVSLAALEHIQSVYGIDLMDGRHRRNIVVRGVDVHDLLGTRFRLGGVTFEGTRPRPPCVHVEQVAAEEGVARALREGRGGICADVVDGGSVLIGDELTVFGPVADPDGLADAIRNRYVDR